MKLTSKKLPLRRAFAGTCHKAQGPKLSKVVVDIWSNDVSPGQLYVAVSRVRKIFYILLIQNTGDPPQGAQTIQPMTILVTTPVLKEVVQLEEGENFH